MSNRKLRVARVTVWKDRRGANYGCYDRQADLYTIGKLAFGRVISNVEATQLRRRLEGSRYERMNDVVFEVLKVRVGIQVSPENTLRRLDG